MHLGMGKRPENGITKRNKCKPVASMPWAFCRLSKKFVDGCNMYGIIICVG